MIVKPRQQHLLSLIAYAVIVSIGSTGCASHNPSRVFVTTNQEYIEQVTAESVDLEDVRGMFARIFATLPEEVTIYPTENYYYFKLFTNHREIWGNMRLDHQDRDRGILDFAYFEVHGLTDPYFNFSRSWYKPLASEDGVLVQKQDPFTYTVTADGRMVTFHLNQIEQIVPSGIKLRPDEVFISRNCDESGFQFILIFDQKRRAFRFLLDESAHLPDLLQPFGRDVFVGMRSGFAFYQEPDLGRKLLFGVDARNVEVNNYFDGPFDQLGDNFIDPEKFEEYVTLAYPFYRGKVKGRGDFIDEKGHRTGSRVLISAYFSYTNLRDLWVRVASCLEMESDPVELSSCIGRDEKDPAYAYLRARESRTIKRSSRSSKKSR